MQYNSGSVSVCLSGGLQEQYPPLRIEELNWSFVVVFTCSLLYLCTILLHHLLFLSAKLYIVYVYVVCNCSFLFRASVSSSFTFFVISFRKLLRVVGDSIWSCFNVFFADLFDFVLGFVCLKFEFLLRGFRFQKSCLCLGCSLRYILAGTRPRCPLLISNSIFSF